MTLRRTSRETCGYRGNGSGRAAVGECLLLSGRIRRRAETAAEPRALAHHRIVATDLEHQRTLDATLRAVIALLDKQALVHQLVARTDTRKHALVQSLVERQHAVELEKKLNSLHPADAAFVLESLQQQQRMTAWQLSARERRGAVLLELAEAVRASLVTLLDEPELIALGRQMEAEDFADLVQDLPQQRVEAVLAQLGSEERAEVRTVLSFPERSVGALMQLEVVTVRADVTLEEAIESLRRRGSVP